MGSIPSKYFKAENLGEALMNIRRLLREDGSSDPTSQMTSELTRQYIEETTDSDSKALGKLLTAVYDFSDREMARKCADHFKLFPRWSLDPQRSVSHQIFRNHFNGGKIHWLCDYTKKTKDLKTQPEDILDTGLDYSILSFYSTDNAGVMTEEVYWVIEPSLTVNFLAIESCPLDMIIDEEVVFEETGPLYFSECSHFTSPVYKVKVAKKTLEFCLEKIGFPYVKIKPIVYFRTDGKLLNIKDYFPGAPKAQQWEGVDVYAGCPHDKRKGYLFRGFDLQHELSQSKDSTEHAMLSMLIYSLQATTAIFRELSESHQLYKHSHDQLCEVAKRIRIFR